MARRNPDNAVPARRLNRLRLGAAVAVSLAALLATGGALAQSVTVPGLALPRQAVAPVAAADFVIVDRRLFPMEVEGFRTSLSQPYPALYGWQAPTVPTPPAAQAATRKVVRVAEAVPLPPRRPALPTTASVPMQQPTVAQAGSPSPRLALIHLASALTDTVLSRTGLR